MPSAATVVTSLTSLTSITSLTSLTSHFTPPLNLSATDNVLTKPASPATQYKPTETVLQVLETFLRLSQVQDLRSVVQEGRMSALQARVHAKRQRCDTHQQRPTPMQRMQACRDALTRLDDKGWNRSYHQRLFHEDFLVSLAPLSAF